MLNLFFWRSDASKHLKKLSALLIFFYGWGSSVFGRRFGAIVVVHISVTFKIN